PDADMTRAIPGAMNGIMMNQGEVGSAGSRLFVQKKSFDNVMADLVDHSKKIKQGAGMDQDTQMGPLVSREQQDRVVHYINKGKEEGAELLTGGTHTDKGYFVEPNVFADVDDNMTIAKEESFVPGVYAMMFEDLDEVIERANESEYGLDAGLWTESVRKEHYVDNRVINDTG